MLEAIARDTLGDVATAGRAIERALDLAEPDHVLFPLLLYPAPGLLERHARDCARHAAMVSEILTLLPDQHKDPGRPEGLASGGSLHTQEDLGEVSPYLAEPLSRSEIRVLRYLPTNLSAVEIARELSLSVNTVGHIRATCSPNSARTGGPSPLNAPAPSACSQPPLASADSGPGPRSARAG